MLYYIFGIISFLYILLILISIKGWKTIPYKKNNTKKHPTFSILIAVRNESKNITQLISYLSNQTYPDHLFEILIINDHSTDNTLNILQIESNNNPIFKIYNAPQNVTGKKSCIQYIQNLAKNNYYIYTDGDCTMNEKWIETYSHHIYKNSGLFLFGPVTHKYKNGLLEKLFTLDFLSMVGVQAGLANLHHAFSCNAANMCISKDIAQLSKNNKYSSGDDVFLLHSAKKAHNAEISFVKDINAIIYTDAPVNIKHFLTQRIRWSSKATGYKDIDAIIVSNLVYIVNASIFSIAIICIFMIQFLPLLYLMLGSKIIIDLYFFNAVLPFFKRGKLLLISIPFQFFYFIYITLIPIFALLIPLQWKGRRIS